MPLQIHQIFLLFALHFAHIEFVTSNAQAQISRLKISIFNLAPQILFLPSLNLSANFLLFWDGVNERHTKWNEKHKYREKYSITGLRFLAIHPIWGGSPARQHKQEPPHLAINHSGGLLLFCAVARLVFLKFQYISRLAIQYVTYSI